jgi:hypothetical protein
MQMWLDIPQNLLPILNEINDDINDRNAQI